MSYEVSHQNILDNYHSYLVYETSIFDQYFFFSHTKKLLKANNLQMNYLKFQIKSGFSVKAYVFPVGYYLSFQINFKKTFSTLS